MGGMGGGSQSGDKQKTAMEQLTSGQGGNLDYYFESASKPFSTEGQTQIDYRDKLGLRKNIIQNKGNELRFNEQRDRFDQALEQHTYKDESPGSAFKDSDNLLTKRGYIPEKIRENQMEQLRIPEGTMLATLGGLGDLSRLNWKKYKSQKHKGHGLQTEML
jgi:hypothetical protein